MPYLPLDKKPYMVKEISSNSGQSLATFIDMSKDDAGSNTQRAGNLLFADLGTGYPIDGAWENVKNARLYAWSNGRMFEVSRLGVVTEITGVTMLTGEKVCVADLGDVIYFASGGRIAQHTTGTATASYMADPDAPDAVTSLATIDSYLLALSDNTIYFSEPATPTAWAGLLDSVQAESRPDVTNCILAGFQELFAGGAETVEYFYNTGDSVAPWQRIQGAITQRGVLAPRSVQQVDNTWFFIDHDRKVIKLAGRDPQVISTEVIENAIRGYVAPHDAVAIHLPIETTYVINFPADGKTWAYDYKRSTWAEWSLFDNTTGLRSAWIGNCAAYMRAWGKQIVGSRVDSKLYTCSQDSVTDGAYPLYWEMTTGAIDQGTSRKKTCRALHVRHRRGFAGLGVNASFDVSYRNDGDTSFSVPRNVVLGQNGDTVFLTRMFGFGQYRSRQWKFSGSAPAKINIVDAEETL